MPDPFMNHILLSLIPGTQMPPLYVEVLLCEKSLRLIWVLTRLILTQMYFPLQ